MRSLKVILISAISILFFACSPKTTPILKSVAYKGLYDEKPLVVLIMPPINKSTNIEAKEYFHSTLNVPLSNAGYYVIPPFLSMEILKKESAYDAELFTEISLTKFREVFGADIVMFSIIHKWNKTYGNVIVEVEYLLKSTKTNEILYTRRGTVNYNTSSGVTGGGLIGTLVDVAATSINTAAAKYIDVARICNKYTFNDLPAGAYGTPTSTEPSELAGEKNFNVTLNSKY